MRNDLSSTLKRKTRGPTIRFHNMSNNKNNHISDYKTENILVRSNVLEITAIQKS